jgi:hypothetical protein
VTRTIIRERLGRHPHLGRHVHHDSESRRYAFDTAGLSVVSAKHTRRIDVLDQGALGSCTGNAGIGCLGTDPYYASLREDVGKQLGPPYTTGVYPLDENGAVQLYRDATHADDYPGEYPPTDTGSDGLTIAKVLKAAGEIAGYQWTFSLDDALKALGVTPFITGTVWYDRMFDPDPDGRVHPTGPVAGGHEYVADEIDAERERVWCTNSWGTGWGVGGRFYLTFTDYGSLLAQQGDVTIFTPLTEPAPTPSPAPVEHDPADVAFADVLWPWVACRHTGRNRDTARAAKAWLTAKGL